MWVEFPPDFDANVYRASNEDLRSLSGKALRDHYEKFGVVEGRVASLIDGRKTLASFALSGDVSSALEIGPFYDPVLRGNNVKYFDVLDRDELERRATSIGLSGKQCPTIDFVSACGNLGIVQQQFDVVLSSHVIEHQPDLIDHLQNVERILNPGGVYLLVVPDRRFCFDFFLPASPFSEVVAAHLDKRRLHSLSNFLDHRLMLTHNDPARHWSGDHGSISSLELDKKIEVAMSEWHAREGDYIDVHAWQFTPDSFSTVILLANRSKLCGLKVERIYPTLHDCLEFYVVLRKVPD